ncbi:MULTISPECIES: (2Fe-2S) ferredoxin domain-containing protein [unclassified Chamaesiphon]|uniref:(2Fe-2S) ferredoxin domain-containing protein n=1 Tax=unclassified Chamaesiphon TaxID=2620921 RepID=UPI00286BB71E|nr:MULTISPECIES: (2Fe-2S) ferredoxin domain-containing protein [unclassified Chamaesiphon]
MADNLVDAQRSPEPICILVCQNRTCRKQGAADVLAAFRAIQPPTIAYEGCGCLGNCGNGPMALVLPARIWYYHIRPQDVSTIIAAATAESSNCE